jgi:hypothetical protein
MVIIGALLAVWSHGVSRQHEMEQGTGIVKVAEIINLPSRRFSEWPTIHAGCWCRSDNAD